jgi:hypothetical protein
VKELKITQVSTFFANGSYPIEFLFFYPNRINTRKLRRALKKISKQFWPAFSVYANGSIIEKSYHESDCYDESTIDEIFDTSLDHNIIYNNFRSIIPEKIPRLFYLKVIHYNNGTVIIPKLNHLVGDGYSYFYLLTVLAAITNRIGIPIIPTIIKSIFQPKIRSKIRNDFLFTAKPHDAIYFDDKLEYQVLELDKKEIRNQASILSEKSGFRISSNDILSAQVVKFIVENNTTLSDDFRLMIPIDVRRGVPKLGKRFFGNGLIMYSIPFNPETTKQMSIEDIAITIRKTFPDVNLQNYESYLKKIEGWIESGQLELLRPYNPDTECLVTNLSRMPIKKLDFGTGPPTLVEPLTRGRSGAAVLAKDDKFVLKLVR